MILLLSFILIILEVKCIVTVAFKNPKMVSHSIQMSHSDTSVVVFTPNCLRVFDNPCINLCVSRNTKVIPLIVIDEQLFSDLSIDEIDIYGAISDVSDRIKDAGGELVILHGNTTTALTEFLLKRLNNISNIVFCNSQIHPISNTLACLNEKLTGKSFHCISVDDRLRYSDDISQNFDLLSYQPKNIPCPTASSLEKGDVSIFSSFRVVDSMYNVTTIYNKLTKDGLHIEKYGETLANFLVSEYLTIGDDAFSENYHPRYVSLSKSSLHAQSIARLATRKKYFNGEVLSAVLSPLLALGCVSPRRLFHARALHQQQVQEVEVSFASRYRWSFLNSLVPCRLSEEAVRRDWHSELASLHSDKDIPGWRVRFTRFRGYVQREASYIGRQGTASPAATEVSSPSSNQPKPLLVLVHGFGGSLEQFTSVAAELSDHFDVAALDSMGFGRSEKPPLSYNQYLWRDQVVEFVRRLCSSSARPDHESDSGPRRVVVAGNSIGGFTAALTAATLASHEMEGRKWLCQGLVLFNSAGKIVPEAGLLTVPVAELMPEYNGPPPELLRAIGSGIFSLLQPRIAQTCEWLYPTNPEPVRRSLATAIYRDSCDPGAADVIAAGGKLPPPLPFNDLLRQFSGPVLVAQGALDPLNDAVGRAKQLAGIRDGIDTALLQLGHCPMDEGPREVASTVLSWASRHGILR